MILVPQEMILLQIFSTNKDAGRPQLIFVLKLYIAWTKRPLDYTSHGKFTLPCIPTSTAMDHLTAPLCSAR